MLRSQSHKVGFQAWIVFLLLLLQHHTTAAADAAGSATETQGQGNATAAATAADAAEGTRFFIDEGFFLEGDTEVLRAYISASDGRMTISGESTAAFLSVKVSQHSTHVVLRKWASSSSSNRCIRFAEDNPKNKLQQHAVACLENAETGF
jgi:hypothetical protein